MRYARIFKEDYSKNLNNPHIVCLKRTWGHHIYFSVLK